MLKTYIVLCLLCIQGRLADEVCDTIEDTELVMPFVVHRHGDRSPEKEEVFLSEDPDELVRMSKPFGWGKLTFIGKARSFALGKFFRRRYGQFLSPSYNASDIFIRSTEFNRTQVTAQIAITAAYSSKQLWSDGMELVPVDCNKVPPFLDPNLSIVNCPNFLEFFVDVQKSKPKEMSIYNEVLQELSENLQFNLTKTPLVLYAMNDVFASQQSVGLPISNINRPLLPAMQEGAGLALTYIFGNQTFVPLQAGVLLNEFFEAADLIRSGAHIPRIRVLSAHDFNVYSFTEVTKAIPKQGVPGYCSVYSLELRKCKDSGRYVVVPVYLRSPSEPESYLEIENCGVICDFHKFRALTSVNTLNDFEYKEMCANNDTATLPSQSVETK